MHAAQVEGVAQLLTTGVRFVVTVRVFSFVTNQATRYTTQLIGIASFGACRLVDVTQEARNNVLDSVSTAEGAYKSGLLGRISSLFNFVCYNIAFAAAHWPAAYVVRVHILPQDLIYIARRAVLVFEDVGRILAGTRPVE